MLRDRTTYVKLLTSSKTAYIKMNEDLLKRLVAQQKITKRAMENAISNETEIANIYFLIKNHKNNTPLRPIVNTRSSMGYTAAKYVTSLLTQVRDEGSKYNVLNSRQACEKLKQTNILPDEKFYSFDIVSMFTNIPVERAINSVKKRQKALGINDETLHLIIDIITFVCVKSTEMAFNNSIFKQIRGLRMGSSLSPILADFVVEDMLDTTFLHIPRPKFLIKYVDDLLTILEEDRATEVLKGLNEMDPDIKFEMEKEEGGKINYLDFTIINEGWCFKTIWYQKDVSSGQFLNYLSTHSKSNIWNTAVQYVATMFLNTHTDFHQQIEHTAKERLKRNSYPDSYANNVITAAKEKIFLSMDFSQRSIPTNTTADAFYTTGLSYIPKLTGSIQQSIRESATEKGEHDNLQVPTIPIYKMGSIIFNKHKNTNNKFQMANIENDTMDLTQEDNK